MTVLGVIAEPFIIILRLSQYDLNNLVQEVTHQIIIIIIKQYF